MCAKYEDISPADSPQQMLPLLSSREMRKVLADIQDDSCIPQEEEEEPELIKVLADIPDLEGDCSILSLGWNEDIEDIVEERLREAVDTGYTAGIESNLGESSEGVSKESTREDIISCWSKVKAREKAIPEPVPIQKGNMIEFFVDDEKSWFLVEVTGRGKAGGKNRNYLNVKYSDGSEGGVFIDKHQWRIVKRKEVQEEVRAECSVRLHRVTMNDPDVVEKVPVVKCEDEKILISDSEDTRCKVRKWERSGTKSENLQKQKSAAFSSATDTTQKSAEKLTSQSEGDPASLIRKGDKLEYLLEEEEDTWFLVEVLGRGKVGGKNRNYLNVRYTDGSEGGVFIDKHQWRIARRAYVAEEKLHLEERKKE